ncbi:uncharacterized protein ACHE_50898A [Aspergillus chevalieri]|uniref:Uncharacterized protein n=1 Tax=Aspergillus chevalieri TaxID=182096 RepID=A0A7R7VRW8_ASPCH|nr:uncharacterized protein ACHE_50898A [Aspergillus chevalieri]BCR89700.1 hypothetical protein ACHE_50898A [Aspergillus chevalieri]
MVRRQYSRIEFTPGIPAQAPQTSASLVDTVVPVQGHRDQLYVFFGGRYLEIKIDDNPNDNSVNGGARTIPSGWKSLEKVGFDIVDAAVVVPGNTNQLYFFELKGWPNLVEAGFDAINAIVESPSGEDVYYVFCGDKYAKIKIDTSRKDTLNLSTRLISSGWKTLDGWA